VRHAKWVVELGRLVARARREDKGSGPAQVDGKKEKVGLGK
jgi:hypothetical protein